MNLIETLKEIEILESKLAQLKTVASGQVANPRDLIGKLCYVFDSDYKLSSIRVVNDYKENDEYKFKVALTSFMHAVPVPEEDVLNLVSREKKKTRYDWSKVPEKAKYMYTDKNGNIFWSTVRAVKDVCSNCWGFDFVKTLPIETWDFVSKNNPPCEDWENSEEMRP